MNLLEKIAAQSTKFAGSSFAFSAAFGIIIIWLITGPFFNYSDTWQLVINTGTTIITFLMVFLIQRSQNKDVLVLHTKLNEIIHAISPANNKYINIEELAEEDVVELHEEIMSKLKKEANVISSEIHTAEAKESAERAQAEIQIEDPKDLETFKKLLRETGEAHENTK